MRELSIIISDIVENSFISEAKRIVIEIREDYLNDVFEIRIDDDGMGMDEVMLARALDPFFSSKNFTKGSFGIAELKAASEKSLGSFQVETALRKGIHIRASFVHSHEARAPLGNIAETIANMAARHPEVEVIFRHRLCTEEYELNTREMIEKFGEMNFETISGIKGKIREDQQKIRESIRKRRKEMGLNNVFKDSINLIIGSDDIT